MRLVLRGLAAGTRGIYKTAAGPNTLPARFRFLHPEAAEGFRQLEQGTGGLVYSDVLRSAEEQLHAVETKRGTQTVAFSGHNFGFSFDCAVEETLALRGWDYGHFLTVLESYGWFCHRRDGARGYRQTESWHQNYFGGEGSKYLARTVDGWAAPIEARIMDVYGSAFVLDVVGVQAGLKKLGLYAGDVDGIGGPLTRQGIGAFQRTWRLADTGIADARTQRVLAFVAAEHEVV